jgi:GNAT superfamily N-acetyltransferase
MSGPVSLPPSPDLRIRAAVREDLAAIQALLADDAIAQSRTGFTTQVTPAVEQAFAEIAADPNNVLVVGDAAGEVVATLQLTFIAGLSRNGMRRALVEAVRVRSDHRGRGLGEALLRWAIERARERGCGLVQLTTDKRRVDAQRFYARLGFIASHEGMKLQL